MKENTNKQEKLNKQKAERDEALKDFISKKLKSEFKIGSNIFKTAIYFSIFLFTFAIVLFCLYSYLLYPFVVGSPSSLLTFCLLFLADLILAGTLTRISFYILNLIFKGLRFISKPKEKEVKIPLITTDNMTLTYIMGEDKDRYVINLDIPSDLGVDEEYALCSLEEKVKWLARNVDSSYTRQIKKLKEDTHVVYEPCEEEWYEIDNNLFE